MRKYIFKLVSDTRWPRILATIVWATRRAPAMLLFFSFLKIFFLFVLINSTCPKDNELVIIIIWLLLLCKTNLSIRILNLYLQISKTAYSEKQKKKKMKRSYLHTKYVRLMVRVQSVLPDFWRFFLII